MSDHLLEAVGLVQKVHPVPFPVFGGAPAVVDERRCGHGQHVGAEMEVRVGGAYLFLYFSDLVVQPDLAALAVAESAQSLRVEEEHVLARAVLQPHDEVGVVVVVVEERHAPASGEVADQEQLPALEARVAARGKAASPLTTFFSFSSRGTGRIVTSQSFPAYSNGCYQEKILQPFPIAKKINKNFFNMHSNN